MSAEGFFMLKRDFDLLYTYARVVFVSVVFFDLIFNLFWYGVYTLTSHANLPISLIVCWVFFNLLFIFIFFFFANYYKKQVIRVITKSHLSQQEFQSLKKQITKNMLSFAYLFKKVEIEKEIEQKILIWMN